MLKLYFFCILATETAGFEAILFCHKVTFGVGSYLGCTQLVLNEWCFS